MLRDILGENVRYYRKKKDLTLEAAAEICDMSSKYLGKVERGKQAASIDIIDKISKGLDVPAEKLLEKREGQQERG